MILITLFSVEWSSYENFLPLSGEAIVEDLSHLEFEIKSLTKGSHYFVRVCAWNVKGYGPYCNSEPLSAAPSSECFHFNLCRNCLFEEKDKRRRERKGEGKREIEEDDGDGEDEEGEDEDWMVTNHSYTILPS